MTDKPIHIVTRQPAPRTGLSLEAEREWSDTYAYKANISALREIRRKQAEISARRWTYINVTLALAAPIIALFIAGYLP